MSDRTGSCGSIGDGDHPCELDSEGVCVTCGWAPTPERWHVISGERLQELLRRAHAGENPDLIYIEEYVNANRESVE